MLIEKALAGDPPTSRRSATTQDEDDNRQSFQILSGGENLLANLLGEASAEAEIEEELIANEQRKLEELERAKQILADREKRAAARDALEEERQRLARAKEMRDAVRREIRTIDKPDNQPFSPPTSIQPPSTGELTLEQVIKAAKHVRSDAPYALEEETDTKSSRLLIVLTSLILTLGLGGGIGVMLAGGPEIDPNLYPKGEISLTSDNSQTVLIAMSMVPEVQPDEAASQVVAEDNEPDSRSTRHSRRSRRSSRRARSTDNTSSSDSSSSSRPARPSISLDDGDSLFNRGSE